MFSWSYCIIWNIGRIVKSGGDKGQAYLIPDFSGNTSDSSPGGNNVCCGFQRDSLYQVKVGPSILFLAGYEFFVFNHEWVLTFFYQMLSYPLLRSSYDFSSLGVKTRNFIAFLG